MGILPLLLPDGVNPTTLAIGVGDRIEIEADAARLAPRCKVPVALHRADGRIERFAACAAVETQLEVEQLRDGGVMPSILKRIIETGARGQGEPAPVA